MARGLMAGLVMAASAFSAAANASSYTFGSLLSGSFAPNSSFAQLSVAPLGTNAFHFTLASANMNALFTDGSFIGAIAVNTTSNTGASNVTISNFSSSGIDGGVSGVSASNGGGPGGNVWDFRFSIGAGGSSDRFGGLEVASWTATFDSAAPVQFGGPSGSTPFAVHVQGLTGAQGGSAWYAPSATSAAPEPEIYAMMMAGALMVGFVARRRRQVRPA